MPQEELMGFYEELFVNVKLDKEVRRIYKKTASKNNFLAVQGRSSSTYTSFVGVRSKFSDNRRFACDRTIYFSSRCQRVGKKRESKSFRSFGSILHERNSKSFRTILAVKTSNWYFFVKTSYCSKIIFFSNFFSFSSK